MSRFHRPYRSKPTPRVITVKYAGKCACCGGTIKAGAMAQYYPVGTIANRTEGAIAHMGGLDGNSQACYLELRKQMNEQAAVNDYAGDGLDARIEDDYADRCR